MAKNKILRVATILAVIFTAVMVNSKPTCPKIEKDELKAE